MANMKLELTWVGKEQNIQVEPRILIEREELSYSRPNNSLFHEDINDNILIHGDNLLALKALEAKYSGKVKCIYIDPPYNTGSAFEHYDDNLEHSIWLNLMKSRLEILKKLLSEDGLIFIQIDDNEQAYLKILCDEIFGRKNFVNCVIVKMSPSSGLKRAHKEKGFIKNKEFILVYCKETVKIKPLYDPWEKYDSHYSVFFDNKIYSSLLSVLKNRFPTYDSVNYKNIMLYPDVWNFVKNNASKIYRSHDASRWALERAQNNEFELLFENEDFQIIKVFNPTNVREYEILKSKNRFTGFDRLEPLSWNMIDNEVQTLRGDLWNGFERDMGNVSKEGNGVKFAASKKPERLISDIIRCSTNEGDIVLDSFLGSGTTIAVAHKMRRKWIGIEMGEHAYTHCKVRLDGVINNVDYGGITALTGWRGGGGYKFYELAPTLVKTDSFGQEIINPEYNADMLASAVAIHEGFTYSPDSACYWKQAYNGGSSYLFVTTNHVNRQVIDSILTEMKEDEHLVIVCKSFDGNSTLGVKNITIKKIPQALLKNCEFDVDNYNLNIVTPPQYEEEDEEDE